MKIKFAAPPPVASSQSARERATARGKAQRFVEELKKRPGEWAQYPSDAPLCKQFAQTNKFRFPGTEWTSRAYGKGFKVWARWVGFPEGEKA